MQVLLCCLALLAGARQATAQTAHFAGVVSPVGSGFNYPYGVAVDANGNVFVADFGNNAVKEIVAGTNGAADGTINSSSTVIEVGSGFSFPEAIAVDAHGNVFVADTGNNQVKEIVAGSNGAPVGTVNSTSTVIQVGGTFDNPHGVAVDASGDVFVTSFARGSLYEIVAANGTVNASSTVMTINNTFASPGGVAVDASGDVFVADYLHNAVKEIVAGTGTAGSGRVNSTSTVNSVGSGFSLPNGVAVDANGNVFVADCNNNAVKEILAGTGGAASGTVNSSSTVKSIGSSYHGANAVAVSANGNIFVSFDPYGGPNAVAEIQPGTVNFGSVAMNISNPPTTSLTFRFDSGGLVNGISVLGEGYSDAKTGTCTTNGSSHSYAVGDTCTVDVNFQPDYFGMGQKVGAVLLLNSSNTAFATAHLVGVGTSSRVSFPGSTYYGGLGNRMNLDVIYSSMYNYVLGSAVALDGYNHLFVANQENGLVYEGTTPINQNYIFGQFVGLAIDGAGDVFVATSDRSGVQEIVADSKGAVSTKSYMITLGQGLFDTTGYVAVDTKGNVFTTDPARNRVMEIVAGTGGAPDGTVNASSSVVNMALGENLGKASYNGDFAIL